MNEPIISIVMPAYNVEKYIQKSIDSVLRQSFCEWELIVVDDCSTDSTFSLVDQYRDPRIIKLRRTENSGTPYHPKEDGIRIARGEWIVNLDADDYLSETYLEGLYKEATLKKVDMCTSQLILVDSDGNETGERIPKDSYEFGVVKKSTEGFSLIVPRWTIGLNGSLTKRSVWLKAFSHYAKEGRREIFDDENLSRLVLLESNGFVSAREKYFFRSNPTSVTKKFSLRAFGWMHSNSDLKEIARSFYGSSSEEYANTEYYDYFCYTIVLRQFLRNATQDILSDGIALLKTWHRRINWQCVTAKDHSIKQKIFRQFKLSLLLSILRHPRQIWYQFLLYKVYDKLLLKIKTNPYYAWFVTRKQREKKFRNQLKSYYASSDTEGYAAFAACIFDGAIPAGGLADRLKGIIGVYYLAKSRNIPFKLYFRHPFPMEDFLVPNQYDWRVDKKELCLNPGNVDVVVLDSIQDSAFEIKEQKEYLSAHIANHGKQIHVYTNTAFAYELDYAALFNELFKPSKRLQMAIDRECAALQSKYISISCRFLDLLGDFNETWGYGKPLSEYEKKELLERIDHVLAQLHSQFPDRKILVNSDSSTFLKRYMNVDYVHMIPGNITHIDADQDEYSYETYEKTFLDFMMIAGAERIYLIKSDKMHKSGYPYAASKIFGRPFEIIQI